jgi:CRISPR system Cascade subunit CasE
MFLSRLALNARDRQARCDLAQPYEMHRTLWRAFPDKDPGRVLFRVDTDRSGACPILLVQSDLRPAWERLDQREPRYLAHPPEVKEVHLTFVRGLRLRFRLRANPTKKVGSLSKSERVAGASDPHGGTKNGRRIALLRVDDQVAWLLHKGEQGGFRIPGEWVEQDGRKAPNFRVDVVPEGWVRCGKEGHADGRFYAVRFDGVLEVTDPDQFAQTLADGIGSAKGFGFGLLSLAPDRG